MEVEYASWAGYYPGIMELVCAPKWYVTGSKDDPYTQKIVSSKHEDEFEYFLPYIQVLLKEMHAHSYLGQVTLVTIVPNSHMSYSPTLESLGKWIAGTLSASYEKVVLPLREGSKKRPSTAEGRYNEANGSIGISRKIKPEEVILILDDTKTSGMTLLECIKMLKENGARNFNIICLGINHNPKKFVAAT